MVTPFKGSIFFRGIRLDPPRAGITPNVFNNTAPIESRSLSLEW